MKTKFKIIGVVAAVALVVTAAYAATSAGSSSDPLVTLSYLTQVFTPQVEEDMEAMVSEKADELTGKLFGVFRGDAVQRADPGGRRGVRGDAPYRLGHLRLRRVHRTDRRHGRLHSV